MQSGNLAVVAEVWMLLCTISIPHVEGSIAWVLATWTINKRHWGLSFTEHQRTMGRIKKGNLYLNHMKVSNPWENKDWILSVILNALLLAGLVERERALRVKEENMQNFFYLQETLVFNRTAASIGESDARICLSSLIPSMSWPSFTSRSTTTRIPFRPPTIILEPTSTPKDQLPGDDHRVPVWTLSSEVGHDFSEGCHELPETKFAKELNDEIGELTEEEQEEMSGLLEDYLLTDLKEKMKHKATEVREKRTRRTLKGKPKVEFHKSLSDDSEEEILDTDDPLLLKVLQRIDRMNGKISKTSEDVWRMPTSSRSPPTKSPFVTRESSAFAALTEVCGGVTKCEWSDDSEEDKTNALKMETPPFDGRNVEKYAEKFGRYLVLTGKTKAKDRVKGNLIVQGIKYRELQERESKWLKSATSFEDFLKKHQDLYSTLETDLSFLGEISRVSHLPYDPKAEQVVKSLETLERLFDKLNPGPMTEERKLMELSSKVNDKLFVKRTKDVKLFARMHSYGLPKNLMKERTQLSVGFKHLAASRGSTSGHIASSRYQEKQRDKEKDTFFSGGPSSGSSGPKADISELLSQCHSMIAELRVSERKGKEDKGRKGSGKGKGRGRAKGQGGRGGKVQTDPNALIAEFKARIQCKHCGKTSHYSDHCLEIQRKQKEDRLKTFPMQSGLSEEAAQKAVEDAKKKWKDQKQKGPRAGPRRKDASGPSAASSCAGAPSAETKPMQEDTESQAKKRKRDLAFSEVEKIVDLLRAPIQGGLTL